MLSVRVHVEFGLSTLIGDSDDLTEQLSVASFYVEDDDVVYRYEA